MTKCLTHGRSNDYCGTCIDEVQSKPSRSEEPKHYHETYDKDEKKKLDKIKENHLATRSETKPSRSEEFLSGLNGRLRCYYADYDNDVKNMLNKIRESYLATHINQKEEKVGCYFMQGDASGFHFFQRNRTAKDDEEFIHRKGILYRIIGSGQIREEETQKRCDVVPRGALRRQTSAVGLRPTTPRTPAEVQDADVCREESLEDKPIKAAGSDSETLEKRNIQRVGEHSGTSKPSIPLCECGHDKGSHDLAPEGYCCKPDGYCYDENGKPEACGCEQFKPSIPCGARRSEEPKHYHETYDKDEKKKLDKIKENHLATHKEREEESAGANKKRGNPLGSVGCKAETDASCLPQNQRGGESPPRPLNSSPTPSIPLCECGHNIYNHQTLMGGWRDTCVMCSCKQFKPLLATVLGIKLVERCEHCKCFRCNKTKTRHIDERYCFPDCPLEFTLDTCQQSKPEGAGAKEAKQPEQLGSVQRPQTRTEGLSGLQANPAPSIPYVCQECGTSHDWNKPSPEGTDRVLPSLKAIMKQRGANNPDLDKVIDEHYPLLREAIQCASERTSFSNTPADDLKIAASRKKGDRL